MNATDVEQMLCKSPGSHMDFSHDAHLQFTFKSHSSGKLNRLVEKFANSLTKLLRVLLNSYCAAPEEKQFCHRNGKTKPL